MTEKEERRVPDERRYAVLTKETIRLIAEAAGYSDITDDAAALLGEDASYRLREATHYSSLYMKHAKRKKLTTEDFNKALKMSDVQPIHGHNFPDPLTFRQTKEGEIFFVDDADVSLSSLALNENVPQNNGETSIKTHWLAVNGVTKSSSLSQPPAKVAKQEISDSLQKYYDVVTNIVLSSDTTALKFAMKDLSCNPQLSPLLPHFVSFIFSGVRSSSHDVGQLTKFLHMVKAIINNTSLFLEPQSCLSQLVQGVTNCLLEPLAASIDPRNDHWVLRDYAARLLAQIVSMWTSPSNHLSMNTIHTLKEVLHDHTKPFCCHYGAVMGLLSLGTQVVKDILIPHLPEYWVHLNAALEDVSFSNMATKADAHKVHGALQQGFELFFREELCKFEKFVNDSVPLSSQEADEHPRPAQPKEKDMQEDVKVQVKSEPTLNLNPSMATLYSQMYEYFGDSLAMKLPLLNDKCDLKGKVFLPKKSDSLVSLSDPEASKSGEELLAEFMEQVKIQQKLDKERMERERLQRQIDFERRERERKLQEEHHKLMEAGKKRLEEIRQVEIAREREEMERLEHEQRRNKKLAEQRISKMLQSDDEDEFEEEVIPYHQPKRFRSRSQVQYAEVDEEGDVAMSEQDPSYSASGAASKGDIMKTSVSNTGSGIKLKIITRPGKHLKVKPIEHLAKEAKKSSHSYKSKSSPHQKESKHSPYHQRESKSSPHVHKESRNSPLAHPKDSPHHRDIKGSPHFHREAKDSPQSHRDVSYLKESKHSPHSHRDSHRDSPHYKESKHSPHIHGSHRDSPHHKESKLSPRKDSPHYRDSTHSSQREIKHSPHARDPKEQKHKRKKSGPKSDRKDEFEFESDPEDFTPFSFKSHQTSSDGESSDGASQRKPLTLKLKVKDKEFSPD